jgi:hypothetical protein
LAQQFKQLNYSEKANELALQLLVLSQGVAVLASAFNDADIIKNQVDHIHCKLVPISPFPVIP